MTKLSRLLDREMADGAYQDPRTSSIRRRSREIVGASCCETENFSAVSGSGVKGKIQ